MELDDTHCSNWVTAFGQRTSDQGLTIPASVVHPASASSSQVVLDDGTCWHRHGDHLRQRACLASEQGTSGNQLPELPLVDVTLPGSSAPTSPRNPTASSVPPVPPPVPAVPASPQRSASELQAPFASPSQREASLIGSTSSNVEASSKVRRSTRVKKPVSRYEP